MLHAVTTINIYAHAQISRVAYYEGVVICTCEGCSVKHLIADNKGLLDFPEFGRNIEEYMAAQNNGERYAIVVHYIIVT